MSSTNYARGPGGKDDRLARRLSGPVRSTSRLVTVPLRRARSVNEVHQPGVRRPLLRVRWLARKVLPSYEVKLSVEVDATLCQGEPVVVEIFRHKDGASKSLGTQELPTTASALEGSFTYALEEGDLEGPPASFSFKATVKGQTLESASISFEPLPDPFEALQWRDHGKETEPKNGRCGREVDLFVGTNPISAPNGTEVVFEIYTHEPVEGEPEKVAEVTGAVADGGATAAWTYAYEPPAEGQPYWRPKFTYKAKATIKDGREVTSEASKALAFVDRLKLEFVDNTSGRAVVINKQNVLLAPPDGGKVTRVDLRDGKLDRWLLPGVWKLVGLKPDLRFDAFEPGPLS